MPSRTTLKHALRLLVSYPTGVMALCFTVTTLLNLAIAVSTSDWTKYVSAGLYALTPLLTVGWMAWREPSQWRELYSLPASEWHAPGWSFSRQDGIRKDIVLSRLSEDEREIVQALAQDFDGPVRDLLEASKILAKESLVSL